MGIRWSREIIPIKRGAIWIMVGRRKRPQTDYEKFKMQRYRAAHRGIDWKLEYWEWMQIWQDSGHFHERGKKKGQWCMARHGDQGAYETGNVKIVLFETNSSEACVTKKLKSA